MACYWQQNMAASLLCFSFLFFCWDGSRVSRLSGSVTGVLAALPSCFIFNAIVIFAMFLPLHLFLLLPFLKFIVRWNLDCVTMVPFHHGKIKAENRNCVSVTVSPCVLSGNREHMVEIELRFFLLYTNVQLSV
jgi:hypothetical protein